MSRRTTSGGAGDAEALPGIEDLLSGFALAAGAANVVMQLSRLPIGHGVARSRVDSGRVDKHPIKRLRTTNAYLVIALLGTDAERDQLKAQIDRVHARVVSGSGDPVAYRALDPELQLWVAACLYRGVEDVHTVLHGTPSRRLVDEVLYPNGARLATTLQVCEDQWPVDRDAFETYWQRGLADVAMDDVTRPYLQDIATRAFLFGPLGAWGRPGRWLLRRLGPSWTMGFLPEPFRSELGLPWTARHQRRFDRNVRVAAAVNRRLPGPLRRFPLNVYLWDTRRRLASGRPVL